MTERNYIVFRRSPNLPESIDTGDLDGKWFDIETMLNYTLTTFPKVGVAIPTGRFETNDNGQVAEVYELQL